MRELRLGVAVTALVAAVAAMAVLAPAAGAATGSILYRQGGKLWLADPDGKPKRVVPRSRGLENPSQDDRGRIVAQRGITLHRLDRRGRALNRPFTTPFRTSPLLPAFKGPFWPEVSPDGRMITYTYSLTASRFDPSCLCYVTTPSLNTSYTRSDRPTNDPASSVGLARMYSRGSWIDSRSVLLTTESLYDFGGNILDTVAIDRLGGGADSYQRWFAECVGCTSLQTLQLYPLTDGEVTRRKHRMVFVGGELGTKETGSALFLYELTGPAPASIPQRFCRYTRAAGKFSSPTWSPDGRSLAWADRRGVWVGRVRDLSGDRCDIRPRLLARGGTSPDWGPKRGVR